MKNRMHRRIGIVIFLLGIVLASVPIIQVVTGPRDNVAVGSFFDRIGLTGGYEQELQPGEYITIVDEKSGAVVEKIGRVVYPGDELINEANAQYRVTKVKGNKAFARKTGVATGMVWNEEWETAPVGAGDNQAKAGAVVKSQADDGAKPAQAGGKSQIAIYHTHSDESYVPTDGSSTIPGRGGIFKVGSALASELKAKGVSVVDNKTPHDPHDANAYHRSRKTAAKLMKERPLALLDVHRDGVEDPEFYKQEVQGQAITKVRLVVGRQNPNMKSNMEFAKKVKSYMDAHKPGLIKGIFIGRGNYNQDLSPRALLLEIGTHTNDRFRAEKGADLFADAFPAILGITPQGQDGAGPGKTSPFDTNAGERSSAWSNVAWIIGAIVIGGAIFLLISTGSFKGMTSKLSELRKTEFASFFGLKKTARKDRDRKDE